MTPACLSRVAPADRAADCRPVHPDRAQVRSDKLSMVTLNRLTAVQELRADASRNSLPEDAVKPDDGMSLASGRPK